MATPADERDGWVWPDPSLDEDDRFQVAFWPPDESRPYGCTAIRGPSGYGCFYCGGPYDGLIVIPPHNERGHEARAASCKTHQKFGRAWLAAGLASREAAE
jgi:hypothetical protein